MEINFREKPEDLGTKVRSILGVPEEILTNDIISSPVFLEKAKKYINKKIEEYENLDETFLNIACIYYICYLICPGMYSRLPKQMENVNTKTVLQSTDWYAMASEMLDKCNSIIDDAIEEKYEDSITYGNTFAVLTNESEYPNTSI